MIFSTWINRIPCQCHVLYYAPKVRAAWVGVADSHPPESEEFEYEILDRDGNRARWLEKMITPAIDEALLAEYHIMSMGELLEDAEA